jgi:hypothetical protein
LQNPNSTISMLTALPLSLGTSSSIPAIHGPLFLSLITSQSKLPISSPWYSALTSFHLIM